MDETLFLPCNIYPCAKNEELVSRLDCTSYQCEREDKEAIVESFEWMREK